VPSPGPPPCGAAPAPWPPSCPPIPPSNEAAVTSDLFAAAFRRASHVTDLRETPIWVETADVTGATRRPALLATFFRDRPEGFARPATFDADHCWRHLRDGLAERGLAQGRIGLESAALAPADLVALAAQLPRARLVDATEVIGRLRMMKSPAEIGICAGGGSPRPASSRSATAPAPASPATTSRRALAQRGRRCGPRRSATRAKVSR
jgi:hypothetical protein